MKYLLHALFVTAFYFQACDTPQPEVKEEKLPLWNDNPWPDIRKQRITKLLLEAMKASNVDAWLFLCRENHNDPIATHVGFLS